MSIRAVIFDFGGVLCFHPTADKIAEAAEACGMTVPEFERAFWSNRTAYDAGEVDSPTYWRQIAAQGGLSVDEAWVASMQRREIDFWSRFDDRVFAWIDQLRREGFRTGILSNLPDNLGRHLRASKTFLQPFDHVTFSYELRLIKPQAAIYEDAVRGLGIAREEALFLDDRHENVQGALDAGLAAELFESWETFVEGGPERYALPVPTVARRQ